MTERKRTVFKLDEDTKRAFKAKTASEGVTMNEKAEELIKNYINNNDND